MRYAMRRARWPLLLAPVAALMPAVAGAAPAGPGTPPPLRAGQVLASYYPHRTSVFPTAAARDAAGRIVATGTFSPLSGNGLGTSPGVAVARFAATGQADLSFGSAGASPSLATGTIAPDQRLSVQVVTPLPDGGLLVGGSAAGRVFVERFAADGTLDPSFGTGGIVRGAAASAAFSEPRALAVTPLADGTIVFVHTEPQPQSAGAADVFPGGLLIDRL